MPHDLSRNIADRKNAHEDDECFGLPDLAPIDAMDIMSGNEGQHLVVSAMCERNAAVRSDTQRRSHSGHHFERNACIGQRFQLFTAASKNERVAAFQTYYVEPPSR